MPKLKSMHGRKPAQMNTALVSYPSIHLSLCLANQPPAKLKSFYA